MSVSLQLPNLLSRNDSIPISLDGWSADEVHRAARFWFDASFQKMRKAEGIHALYQAFQDRARLRDVVQRLPEDELELLKVVKLYGGTISGSLLSREGLLRGLIAISEPSRSFDRKPKDDPIVKLLAKALLITHFGGYTWNSVYQITIEYPSLLSALPGILDLVKPAVALPSNCPEPIPSPSERYHRAPAEVALDLSLTVQTLGRIGSWKLSRGSLGRSEAAKLRRILRCNTDDSFLPPAPEALYHAILQNLRVGKVTKGICTLEPAVAEKLFSQPVEQQAWNWARAWKSASLWQDGIGLVPDRGGRYEANRIEPSSLRQARELLLWGLGRLARAADQWFDLESFLVRLWRETGREGIHFYWAKYAWRHEFPLAVNKNEKKDEARYLAFWLDDEGVWAANVIMSTMVFLGLVERGGATGNARPCFRLTNVGRAVLAAPDVPTQQRDGNEQFLTVQPNHEILAYMDQADASAVGLLTRFTERSSASGDRVQTFVLTRESAYQGMESGISSEKIETYLRRHSKNGLPDLVARSLRDWSGRREALIVRTQLSLEIGLGASEKGRVVGKRFALVSPDTRSNEKAVIVQDHCAPPSLCWTTDEQGRIQVDENADAVSIARLLNFANKVKDGWRITAASVQRAGSRGIGADQILDWLSQHLSGPLPPILETSIRNWIRGARVFLGELLMLQVPNPQACAALRSSSVFKPMLAAYFPPNRFVVRPVDRARIEKALNAIGFSIDTTWREAVQHQMEEPPKTRTRRKSARAK